MASSFSDLGIELMATGENAGTWGDKTNTNLQIVEKSIAGYVEKAITSGGTTQLTITDGDATESTSVARHAVIKLTGTITGNSIVTVPDSIEKVYIVTNGTSGAYTVQFKTASGTGITFGVSEKTTKLVYSDGTNIVDAGFGGALDIEGRELVLDADGDTTLTADTDDQIDIKIAGADDFQFTANTFTAQSGSSIVVPDGGLTFGSTAITSTAAELNLLDGVSGLVQADLTKLAAVDSTAAELNILDGVTSTAAELNVLDGITAVVGELNALDIGSTAVGTAVASKAVILDANKDYTGIRNLTISGDLTVSGDDITMGTNTAGNILVADGTNFNSIAAGSLSEISTVANDDVFIAVDTSGGGLKKIARSAIVAGLATSGAISNVVEDTTPQLGGNLDMNGADIVTTSNANIELAPNGTGTVVIKGNTNQAALVLNCESNSHGQKIQPQPHSVGSSAVHTLPDITGDLIAGKIGGTNFTNSLLIGHATTGTLNDANSNTGVGIAALDALTSGDANTAVGLRSLGAVTIAVDNTGMGSDSGKNLSAGSNNSSFGKQSLYNAISGNNNVAMGDFALEDATASNNTALGSQAGKEISTSSYNIVIGRQAGDNITTGSGNVIIGTVDAAAVDSARTLKIAGYDGSTTTTWIEGDSNGIVTFADDILIKDNGTIGSASATSAMTIESSGQVNFVGDINVADDIFMSSDSSQFTFGSNSEIRLQHVHNAGLTILHTATGDDSTVNLTLATDEADIAADDVIGQLNFQAPSEGTGTDSRLVAASIAAVSEGDFAADNNATKLSFRTAASETAAEKMSLSSAGLLTIADDLKLQHDGAILSFGTNDEVTLTHVHNDGLLLNADMQLQFRDSAINIRSDADGDLDINADDELELNSTLIDVNGNVEISGTLAQAGIATFAVAANVTQTALTSSSNAVAWDASAKPNAVHVTTENTTFSAPSNAVEGAFIVLEINYNGSHTIAFNTVFEFAASTAPTTTDTDGKTDILVFRYNGAVWQEVGRTLNLSES